MIHRTIGDILSYPGMFLRTVAFTASVMFCLAQKRPNQEASEKMTARIELVVHKAAEPVTLSSPSSPVQITSAQIFFDSDDLAEIQKYGSRAVPVLTKFLLNRNVRIERVAIRLLGAIGGPEIIDPLLEVLDKSTNSGGRYEALLNLKQAPCSKAVPRAILRASQNDPDPNVRDQAREEINRCSN
jgi:PBS lyase HEAT-like repeat